MINIQVEYTNPTPQIKNVILELTPEAAKILHSIIKSAISGSPTNYTYVAHTIADHLEQYNLSLKDDNASYTK